MKNLQLTSIHATHREKAFSLISGTKKRCLLLPLLFDIVLKVPARAIKQEKYIKMIQIRKGEVRLYQFTDDTILYTENSMEFTHTHTHKPTTRSKSSKIAGYKINIQKPNCISDFHGGPVVNQWRGHRFDPCSGKIPHAVAQLSPWATISPHSGAWELQLLSPCATTTEPTHSRTTATKMRSSCTATRE